MTATRHLIVIADDYGIGSATSQGILDLGEAEIVSGTVLLTNSPHAETDIKLWRRRGMHVRMGWHPNLTMDRPILPPDRVPSLVRPDGRFHDLAPFLLRLYLGRIRDAEIRDELKAQYTRFLELVGRPPVVVNGHQHIHVFPRVGMALRDVLSRQSPRPYMRRNREAVGLWLRVPGARFKRACLSWFGTWAARRQARDGFPGCDYLAGVTDPRWVKDPAFFARWLARAPGETVELMVHPGYADETLIGRDCQPGDGQLNRRVDELNLLKAPEFRHACREAGFTLVAPSDCGRWLHAGGPHVA